ncbi:hypothetical protein FOA52_003418 [Chlamydomonas sp. UWO 241]|nr:hypothetical protein FOA52_003418 [Chlamydomonas sp. UWO 241]
MAEEVEVKPLSEEQEALFKENFGLFDKEGTGVIDVAHISTVLRSLGLNPTQAELAQIVAEIPPEGEEEGNGGTIGVGPLMDLFAQRITAIDVHMPSYRTTAAVAVLEAFRVFAGTSDYVSVGQLRAALTSTGEALSAEEADAILAAATADGHGRIVYVDFAKVLTDMM